MLRRPHVKPSEVYSARAASLCAYMPRVTAGLPWARTSDATVAQRARARPRPRLSGWVATSLRCTAPDSIGTRATMATSPPASARSPPDSSIPAQRDTRGSPGRMGAFGEASAKSAASRGSSGWRSRTGTVPAQVDSRSLGGASPPAAAEAHHQSQSSVAVGRNRRGSIAKPPRGRVMPAIDLPSTSHRWARRRATSIAARADVSLSSGWERAVSHRAWRCGCHEIQATACPTSISTSSRLERSQS